MAAPIHQLNSGSSHRIVRIWAMAGLLLLLLPAYRFITHSSRVAVVLGQYSTNYFVFLMIYSVSVLTAGGLALFSFRIDSVSVAKIGGWLRELRARRLIYLLAMVAPWLILTVLVDAVQRFAPGRSAVFQFSLLALALISNLAVATIGRSKEELTETLTRATLITLSVVLCIGVMELLLRRVPSLIPDVARHHLAGDGMFLRSDLVFDKPVRVGFRFQPLLDQWVEYRVSDGDLYRKLSSQLNIAENQSDGVLARFRFLTDENGYANSPPLLDHYDVVVTGDSFTAPGVVPDPWPVILERYTGLTVLNLAMAGYGPQAEANSVELFGLVKRPEWVVVAYFEGNDLIVDAPSFELRRLSGLSWIEHDLAQAGPYASTTALQTLRRGIPELINQAVRGLRSATSGSAKNDTQFLYPLTVRIGENDIQLAFDEPYLSAMTARRVDIETSENLRLIDAAFARIKERTHAAGANLIILYVPSKERVYFPLIQEQGLWDVVLDGVPSVIQWSDGYLGTDTASLATAELVRAHIDDQRDAILRLARANGIQVLDLTANFRTKAAEGSNLYHLLDTHWNQEGHALAAQLLANFIQGD